MEHPKCKFASVSVPYCDAFPDFYFQLSIRTTILLFINHKLTPRIPNSSSDLYKTSSSGRSTAQQQIASQTSEQHSYFLSTIFLKEARKAERQGTLVFIAPINRTMQEFLDESRAHGWPSFRDSEVVWENVRCLRMVKLSLLTVRI